ncbi:MAG: radical SAM protein [Eubacteriales bacterium]|nr:radical SAM protein [Eubacteriales bacterium]
MEKAFDLESYLTEAVKNIISDIVKATLHNPKASVFMAKYAVHSYRAGKLRAESEKSGLHIPPFLIASITTTCNLHCKGCYARANNSCFDCPSGGNSPKMLDAAQWGDIFRQAVDLGISFILTAGGEPFVRRDVLTIAGDYPEILFPIFTNGTMIDEEYIALLDKKRNLIPIISLEGTRDMTDERRGAGTYDKLRATMRELDGKGLLFGASVTVTKENVHQVLSEDFIGTLDAAGCRAIIYVEYVPVDPQTVYLAPDDELRDEMASMLDEMRKQYPEMLLISFPGDEKSCGGCLAAGRGFFHINAFGGAEPCPFSPFSDISVTETSLKESLQSPLFIKLRDGSLAQEHVGGCVLFAQEAQVRQLLKQTEV